ncbi:monooxygenase [Peniophora sp. CONT]|nr:monooxygenase [Peniophora sp. CONT]
MSSQLSTVLIIGAGPVGLITALALAQNGITVRVLDKAKDFGVGQRGSGIAPRTLEAYRLLGIYDDMMKVAHEYPDVLEWDQDGKPLRVSQMMARVEPTPDMPIPNGMRVAQEDTMHVLRAQLEKYNIFVESGMELVKLEQDDTGVSATFRHDDVLDEVRAAYIVSADGAKGPTRKLVGIPFLGESREEIGMLVGDLELFGSLDRVHWHKFQDANSNWIRARAVPEKPDVFFFSSHGPSLDLNRGASDTSYLQSYIRTVTKHDDITVGKVLTLQEWRMNVRMVDRFRAGRVFIAGDAAHVHSPLGGQGLNTGAMDAMNLAWKLAAVIKGVAPSKLLDSYEEERKPVVSDMLQFTNGIAAQTFKAGAASSAWTRSRAGTQLGMHYRWSSILRDELNVKATDGTAGAGAYASEGAADVLSAGDRAPDAPELVGADGKATTLYDLFGTTHHTVLVFEPSLIDAANKVISCFPSDLVRTIVLNAPGVPGAYSDAAGRARRAYGAAEVAVVRPDGVVGALVRGSEGLEAYFGGILSAAVAV